VWFNRFFRMNDTVAFATGNMIWKYDPALTGIAQQTAPPVYSTLRVAPNPAQDVLTVYWSVAQPTRAVLTLYDASGRPVNTIENGMKPQGEFQSMLNTSQLSAGSYLLVLKTHEDKQAVRVVITH
jgi:hypothetical protein